MIKLVSPSDGACVSQLTKVQRKFIDNLDSRINAAAGDFDYLNLKIEGRDYTRPGGVRFRWQSDSADTMLEISQYPDFKESRVYECTSKSRIVYNFLPECRYYWRVKSEGVISGVRSFTAADDMPLCLYIPSLVNVRDFGGFTTSSGERLTPRLLIRGCEMDAHISLCDEGKRILAEEFNIKTDLDLRQEALGVIDDTPLAEYGVKHRLIPCKSYGEFFDAGWDKSNKEIFDILSDIANYPIYMHCWGGADRTGTIIMLLCAILAVDNEDTILEWEFSGLSMWGIRSRNARRFKAFSETLAAFGSPDRPWQENAICYLNHIGVDEIMLNKIRNIFILKEGDKNGK